MFHLRDDSVLLKNDWLFVANLHELAKILGNTDLLEEYESYLKEGHNKFSICATLVDDDIFISSVSDTFHPDKDFECIFLDSLGKELSESLTVREFPIKAFVVGTVSTLQKVIPKDVSFDMLNYFYGVEFLCGKSDEMEIEVLVNELGDVEIGDYQIITDLANYTPIEDELDKDCSDD